MDLFRESSLVMSLVKQQCDSFLNLTRLKYDYFWIEPIDWDSFLPTVDRCLLEHFTTRSLVTLLFLSSY